MPNLSSHINPGRIVIATIGTGAMLAVLASAAFATTMPGATASASASPMATETAGNEVAEATMKLPSGAALVAQCRMIENVDGVDKDNWKSATGDQDDRTSSDRTGDDNGDRDDLTASPLASATARTSPSSTATMTPETSASPSASLAAATDTSGADATASASPTATEPPMPSASPIVLGNGESLAALDAACDKVMSSDKDKDDVHAVGATAAASASATAPAANRADPDDRNGVNGDDRNGDKGKNGHSDSHQGRSDH